MTINGVDIATYNARQLTVQPGFGEMDNKSEWIAGAISPLMFETTVGFKTMKVTVTIRGSTRQEIWEHARNLVTSLLNPAEIKLDGFDHKFFMYLKNATQTERSLKRWHKATLELVGYEYDSTVIKGFDGNESPESTTKLMTPTNDGNVVTPAIIEITPLIGLVSVTVTGVARDPVTGEDKPITVNKLVKDKTVIIDGETGLITEDGVNKFHDVEIWDLPSLLPGTNTITVSNSNIIFRLKYKPRFI